MVSAKIDFAIMHCDHRNISGIANIILKQNGNVLIFLFEKRPHFFGAQCKLLPERQPAYNEKRYRDSLRAAAENYSFQSRKVLRWVSFLGSEGLLPNIRFFNR